MTTWGLVAAGGFFGAIARFAISRWLNFRAGSPWPWGTWLVNSSGSFLLGWLVGAEVNPNILMFAGVGFLGSYTTFSTLHWEAQQFAVKKEWSTMVLYLGVTYITGFLAAFVGLWMGSH
ncbi:fluoride efflux transporter FluC [Desmospora activa]|uniref:Fluoride-specific ion channel FluC n=1 Tax=Desmospora activa DSM 45169 TaxID=1121389 RepID=A0A2T4Z972_9BACL|nr:CrcB family protein [Desmospora activa]PTM58438.1 camphor resistance protein CrcB [Desmospora activa DSM 45169]